ATAPTTHMRAKMCSLGTNSEESLSAIFRKHQSQRATMKQLNANIGPVHRASNSHNDVEDASRRCQPGHAIGGSKSSNTATVMAERSRAIRIAVRAKSIGSFWSILARRLI